MTPTMVAEISSNHNQDLNRALLLIAAAAECGADAVKFQLFAPERLAPANLMLTSGPWKGRYARDLYREAQTPSEWFPALFDAARAHHIEPFASVFCLDGLDYLESIGCTRYKIASFEIHDLELIKAVAKTGKPMVISTGMSCLMEGAAAVGCANMAGANDITVLHCISGYPAPIDEMNLCTINTMRRVWSGIRGQAGEALVRVGLSDHSLGHLAPIIATTLGATMIEKHFTLSRDDGGLDAAFSAEPHEFLKMVEACRMVNSALGRPNAPRPPSEAPQLQLRGRTLQARGKA